MVGIIYAAVILIATTVGAIAGMGGGIIIKPVLDAINLHPTATVAFLSSTAVFLMAVISTTKQIRGGFKVEPVRAFSIAGGAVPGGIAGNALLTWVMAAVDNDAVIKSLQALILICLLIFSIFVMNFPVKTFQIKSVFFTAVTGLSLGLISSFLGVGGGPFNIAFLMLLFSMDIKECTVYSILIILFSQCASLVTLYLANGFKPYDLSLLLFTLPAAALGGYTGARLNRKFSDKVVKLVFNIFLGVVFLTSCYNLLSVVRA